MRVRRHFAAPFVIACRTSGPAPTVEMTSPPSPIVIVPLDAAPPPDAAPAPDARPPIGTVWIDGDICYEVEADAGIEPAYCPDALLPEAPPDRLIRSFNVDPVWCYLAPVAPDDPHKGRVRCPVGGATLILPEPDIVDWQDSRAAIDENTLTCLHEIYSNPPYWEPIDRCPPELLPTLAGGKQPTRKEGDRCYYGTVEVRCLSKHLR